MSLSFRLETLGRVVLRDPDGTVQALPGKSLAMLVWLARARSRSAHRDQIADLLWSDRDEPKAKQSLRQALSQLRGTRGQDGLRTDGPLVQLTCPVTWDAEEFEAAVAARDVATALQLYGGPFLDRFALPGAIEFEQWADLHGRRLAALWTGLVDDEVQALLDRGQAREARELAIRLREADPERERSWRLAIEAALLLGDRPLAEADVAMLERSLTSASREPEAATRRLIGRVQRSTIAESAAPQGGIEGDLVGREAQFARVIAEADRVRQERTCRRIVIEAPPGLGKSRLLRDVARRLASTGHRVLIEPARPAERPIPYALVARIARGLARFPGAGGIAPISASSLVALEPDLHDEFPGAEPEFVRDADLLRTRSAAVADLLGAVAEERPVVLMVDDWQWTDPSSATTIEGALARSEGVPILYVVARRRAAARLDPPAESPTITLPHWSQRDVQAFIGSIASLQDDGALRQVADAVHSQSGGSPLHVCRILDLAAQRGLMTVANGRWRLQDVPTFCDWLGGLDVLSEQVRGLSEVARNALLIVAVAGGPVRPEVLARAEPLFDADTGVALLATGCLAEQADAFVCSHDALADAVIVASGPDATRAAALALARAETVVGPMDRAAFQRTARTLVESGDEATLLQLFARWRGSSAHGGGPLALRASVQLLLGDLATPENSRLLLRSAPWQVRLRASRAPLAAAATLGTCLLAAGAHAALRAHEPAGVRWVTVPLAVSQAAAMPVPTVELLDRSGRRLERDGDTVRIAVEGASRPWPGSWAITRRGVAAFPEFRADSGFTTFERVLLIPSGAGLTGPRVRLATTSSVRLIDGDVNGRPLNATHPLTTIGLGDSVRISARLRISTHWASAAVMLVAVPNWGSPRTSWKELTAIPTPTKEYVQRTALVLPPPPRPGRFHVFLLVGAEPSGPWLASGTNWAMGAPRWDDGNDVGTWGEAEARSVLDGGEGTGRMRTLFRSGLWPQSVAIEVIRLEVLPLGSRPPSPE